MSDERTTEAVEIEAGIHPYLWKLIDTGLYGQTIEQAVNRVVASWIAERFDEIEVEQVPKSKPPRPLPIVIVDGVPTRGGRPIR